MNYGTTGTTPTTYANATYSYDSMGRVNAVGDGNYAANYLYNDLNKLTSTEIKSSSDVSVMTSSRSYDALHRLTNISTGNKSFAYGYNAKNQRESMTLADNSAWNYTYDNLGQVATGNLLDSTTQPVAGKQFAYNYDLIGNRTTARQGSDNAADLVNYTSNLVNQYSAINELLPAYDEDGNMISFNGWIRGYDAENRMIFEANSTDKFEYAYDYQNRRYESKYYLKNGENWVLNKTTRYTWDDWNIIAEHTLQDGVWTLEKSYLWGVDLTASMDAAGGVGALISETNSTGTFFPYYDGNGNIMGYRDASGNLVAEFSYDPFLNVTAIVGNLSDFVYQASTKRFNPVTGSLSYQLRDYSPILGRWITRDPIEEQGGYNLYCMVNNNAIGLYDVLGLRDATNDERNNINCLKDIKSNDNMNSLIAAVIKTYEEEIKKTKEGECNCRLLIVTEALKLLCKEGFKNEQGFKCSSFVRVALKNTKKIKFKSAPNAAAFHRGDDSRFKKSYGFKADTISREDAKMGDIIARGEVGAAQTTNSSHVGIYLGHGLYIGQSPMKYDDEVTIGASTIKIRPVSQLLEGYEDEQNVTITYRDMSEACKK